LELGGDAEQCGDETRLPMAFPFGTHLTLPLRIMWTASIPCNVPRRRKRVRRERRWSTAGGSRPGTGSLRPAAIGAAHPRARVECAKKQKARAIGVGPWEFRPGLRAGHARTFRSQRSALVAGRGRRRVRPSATRRKQPTGAWAERSGHRHPSAGTRFSGRCSAALDHGQL
jgi:hypothetical protein